MKKIKTIVLCSIIAVSGSMFAGVSSVDAEGAERMPVVTSVDPVKGKAIPVDIEWVNALQTESGEKTVEYQEIHIRNAETGSNIGIATIDAGVTKYRIKKKEFSSLKVMEAYEFTVTEYYTDGTESSSMIEEFRTRPPRLKKIRVTKKTDAMDGTFYAKLKWNKRTALVSKEKYTDFEYKIVRRKDSSKLIQQKSDKEKSTAGSIVISDLPYRNMRVKVRVVDEKYGIGKWSKWKNFKAPAEQN